MSSYRVYVGSLLKPERPAPTPSKVVEAGAGATAGVVCKAVSGRLSLAFCGRPASRLSGDSRRPDCAASVGAAPR